MNRRQFLIKTSSSLVAGWALANGLRPDSAAAEEADSKFFAELFFLMNYPANNDVSDYRPVLERDASIVIFERTIGGVTKLYYLDLTNPNATPALLVPGLNAESTRADWSWQTGEVVFENKNGIYLLSNPSQPIPNTKKLTYPTWYPDGATLAVYNHREHHPSLPIPRTSRVDLSGNLLQPILGPKNIWAGFPTVNQTNSNLIAFAGQEVNPHTTYNQDKNYIWLLNTAINPAVERTLDPGFVGEPFDPKRQGRAPWYSPNGQWIAFESNRPNSENLYSIYIQKADGSSPAVQVTDKKWNANHAKWYPDGTQLVVTVLQTPGSKNRGIAKLDVSNVVG